MPIDISLPNIVCNKRLFFWQLSIFHHALFTSLVNKCWMLHSLTLLFLFAFFTEHQELEAATLILQRHIDLEQQIWKCLENLKAAQR